MTTYRNLLAAGAHPTVDPRRAAALRAYLRRLASSLTPSWVPTEQRDDFGWALLAIAARLGEETTRRLDQTPERDAIAFFDFLGLPPMPPRAATGVLAMALAEGALHPVVAPVRTQVEVTAGDDDVPFETLHKLRIVPGRIAELVAVDPATDHIELAPAQVTALERPAPTPAGYAVVAAAAAGSATLQLSPAVGLAPEDVLRIGTAAYRIATVDKSTGIVTLHDELEAPVAPGTAVTRIATFTSFTLRDQQRHAFYVGHSTLFDLKQRATIALVVRPPNLARELTRLDVDYAMWGTKEGDSAPDWHPLVLLGTTDGTLQLSKPDAGTVDKVEVDGRKSRWLRAELPGPVSRPRSLSSPVAEIRVGVASAAPTEPGPTVPDTTEGSRTIAQAFYNGTPLSTARRFFPFGPEPLRFDTFAFAAPEALSKEGAHVAVDITMVDSSLTTFDIVTVADAATARGYGVGRNGDLQALAFRSGGGLRWNPLPAISGDGGRVLLAGAAAVEIATAGTDLVVGVDRAATLRAATIKRSAEPPAPTVDGTWAELPVLDASADMALTTTNGRPPGPVLAPAPSGSGLAAVLFGVADGKLHALKMTESGKPVGSAWREVTVGAEGPTLTGAWRLTPVQGPAWPGRPECVELLALDPDGALWLGGISGVDATANPPTVTWEQLADASVPAADDIAPAATRFRPTDGGASRLWIAYARRGDTTTTPPTPSTLRGLLFLGNGSSSPLDGPVGATVDPKTALHANPSVVSADDRPVTVGLAAGGVLLWLGPGMLERTRPTPRDTPTRRPLLLQAGSARPPEVVLGGTDERLFRAALVPLIVDYTLHNVVAPDSKDIPHYVEVGDPPTAWVELKASNRQFVQGTLRVYQVDIPLEVGTPLTFLQRVPKLEKNLLGAVDPADRTLVRLDPVDTVTKVGARLIIDEVSYRVVALSAATPPAAPVATLSTAVPGSAATVVYESTRPIPSLAGATVRATDLATLAELTTAVDTVAALRFPPPANPTLQEPRSVLFVRRKAATGPLRVLVAKAWTTPPPPPTSGSAGLPGVLAQPLEWTENALERGYQNPELSWEYYDGEAGGASRTASSTAPPTCPAAGASSSWCPTTWRRPTSAARPTTGSGPGSSAGTTADRATSSPPTEASRR
ncbi:hypothetical protein BJF90_34940 [Pseudonocardia sp. CNS-004]|nr:hypothetical protein BJF90_34940 [Pseudonocardia sp. CNS-004]